MSEDRKKELVSTIFSTVLDQDDWNIDRETKIQAEFTTGPTSENRGTIGMFDFKYISVYFT